MGKAENYKKDKPIGEGSYGKVFQGWKLDTQQVVALKFISKRTHNEKELQNIRSEFSIHSQLNHKNIIKMLDYYDSERELVLITECARCSLAELIRPGETPRPDQVQKIASDITSALYYLHSQRILHRDLKPQNVLLGYDGLAKVCDFGFAKNMALDTFLLTTYKGTPLYMAPEIMHCKPYDCKTDLWSLGCILYELMVGLPPFNANELYQLSRMIQGPIHWDKSITGDCLTFLQGLLEKDCHRRLGWPEILDHPYISDGLCVDREVGKFALTKPLTPSQEFAKETQRQDIQRNWRRRHPDMLYQVKPTKKVLPNFHGHANGLLYRDPPTSNLVMVQNGRVAPLYAPLNISKPHLQVPGNQTSDFTQKRGDTKNIASNGVILEGKETENGEANSSDSSLDTLTSSSEDESDDEKDTIVIESRSSGKSADSRGHLSSRSHRQPVDSWISGTILARESRIQDPVEIEEEWLDYLHKNIKEVIRNPETLCERYSLRLILQPLRNQYTGVVVVEKIAFLLSLPFSLETQKDPFMIRNLETVYLESKVVANLIYASKLVVIRRRLEVGASLETHQIPEILTEEDIDAMDKCLRLVCFLIHSDDRFVVQFCDSILGFQAYVLFQLFLTLDQRRSRLTSDTLAILCHLMRILPRNVTILEDIFFDYHNYGDELWKLLAHPNRHIQSSGLRLVGYVILHSEKARDFLVTNNAGKLWKILRIAGTQADPRIVAAAEFVADTLRHLGTPSTARNKAIQQTSLPLKFS